MAQVISLREDIHEYRTPDGTVVPSLSEYLRFMSREIYESVMQYTLDHAADRGTRVHAACEVLDKFGKVNCDADIVPQIKAYAQFKKDYAPEWGLIERSMYHPEMNIACTIDREGMMGGFKILLEIKAQEQLKISYVKAQLNGQKKIYERDIGEGEIDKLYALQLKKDGKYRLIEIEKDDREFMACWTLHKALEKKPRKKKGDTDGNTDE